MNEKKKGFFEGIMERLDKKIEKKSKERCCCCSGEEEEK